MLQRRLLTSVLILWSALFGLMFKVTTTKSDLPNIILIITDDQDVVLNGLVCF